MKLLHIDSSVLGPHSVSRQVSAAIVDRLRKATPCSKPSIATCLLTPLAHLSGSHLAAAQGAEPDAALRGGPRRRPGGPRRVSCRRHRGARRADVQFHDTEPAQGLDRSHPGRAKNFQIRRARPGGTGRQQARHRRDLARRILGPGTPAAVGEHLETYLRWVFGFIGIENPEFISADGIQVGPEHREKALASALQAATDLHAA